MGIRKKKYRAGEAVAFISRKRATKKLQVNLADFRRLCILKGIYPHEPKNKKQAGRGKSMIKTYYLTKDIRFLMHEPVLHKYREFKTFVKKIRKAKNRREFDDASRLGKRKPYLTYDHLVRERYPAFIDAVRDLDDALSMCFLFATLPQMPSAQNYHIHLCRRLTVEFMHYVMSSQSLRKVFVSIKGIYHQAEILGQTVTWITPHKYGYKEPSHVDYQVMCTYVDFYCTMLGFVNYKLYTMLGLHYPPTLELEKQDAKAAKEFCSKQEARMEVLAALTQSLKPAMTSEHDEAEAEIDQFPIGESGFTDDDYIERAKLEAEEVKKFQKLFLNHKFFLNREVPREELTFCIRSFGGQVSWDKTVAIGYSYPETDETITHQIVDRPKISNQYLSRYYVQPQWVFDCINARRLLPMPDYFPGAILPPHLSPFVEEKEGDYVPPEKRALLGEETGEQAGDSDAASSSEDESSDDEQETVEDDDDDDGDDGDVISEEEGEAQISKAEAKHLQQQRQRKRKLTDEPEADDVSATREQSPQQPEQAKKKAKLSNKEQRMARMKVRSGKVEADLKAEKLRSQEKEEKRLGEMMIPKKKQFLYKRIVASQQRQTKEAKKLEEKRKAIDAADKKAKKKAKKRTG